MIIAIGRSEMVLARSQTDTVVRLLKLGWRIVFLEGKEDRLNMQRDSQIVTINSRGAIRYD